MGCRQSAALCEVTLIAGANTAPGATFGSHPVFSLPQCLCTADEKRDRHARRAVPLQRAEHAPYGVRAMMAGVKTCDFCGRQEADEAKTLAWSTSVENGRTKVFCDSCSRENLRAMEGKLDSEYW